MLAACVAALLAFAGFAAASEHLDGDAVGHEVPAVHEGHDTEAIVIPPESPGGEPRIVTVEEDLEHERADDKDDAFVEDEEHVTVEADEDDAFIEADQDHVFIEADEHVFIEADEHVFIEADEHVFIEADEGDAFLDVETEDPFLDMNGDDPFLDLDGDDERVADEHVEAPDVIAAES